MAAVGAHHPTGPREDFRTQRIESEVTRRGRVARERATMTVYCDRCDWSFTGGALAGVKRARAHRASKHPELPYASPARPPLSAMCTIEGCGQLRLRGGGRYTGLCQQHRDEAAARVQAGRQPRAVTLPRRRPGGRPTTTGGGHHGTYTSAACRVAGCEEPWVRRKGRDAHYCEQHRLERVAARAAARPPRPSQPRTPRAPGATADPARRALIIRLHHAGIWQTGIAQAARAAGWSNSENHLQQLVGHVLRDAGLPTRMPYRIPDLSAAEVEALFQQYDAGHGHTL